MLKHDSIEITIGSSNYNKYVEKYGPFKSRDKIIIDIKDLSINSAAKVVAICEICSNEKEVKYQNYNVQIKRDDYYCCKKCAHKKAQTTMRKNGTQYFLSNPEYKNKMIKLYGVDNPSKIKEIKESRSKIMKDENYQEKLKNGVKEKFGVDNVSKLDFIKNQKIKTCQKNYGVDNPSQNEKIFIKAQKSGKKIKEHECGLFYRGSYEKDFLDMCLEKNISVLKGKTLKYNINNKDKYYHSDFYLEKYNLVIEIKSTYYYDRFYDINIAKKESTIESGYNYILILDKNYNEFINFLK